MRVDALSNLSTDLSLTRDPISPAYLRPPELVSRASGAGWEQSIIWTAALSSTMLVIGAPRSRDALHASLRRASYWSAEGKNSRQRAVQPTTFRFELTQSKS